MKEQESQIDQEREKLRNQKRKRELEDKASSSGSKKQRLTDKEQKEKVALDEAELGTTSKGTFTRITVFIWFKESADIWDAPATVDEEKSKEQEMDEYFEDLFL